MSYSSFTTRVNGPKKCGPGKIKVTRQGHTRSDGTRVRGTSYCANDRGKPGRGPKTIPTPRRGSLGGPGYTERSDVARHRLLNQHVATYGYASTISALQSRINLGRSTMSQRALRVFERDKRWLQDKHDKGTTMKRNAKKKTSKKRAKKSSKGMSPGLRKATAIRKAMANGMSKTEANKLWDSGRLSVAGNKIKKRGGSKKKATKKKAAKRRTTKKKATKRTTKKKAAKRTSRARPGTRRKSTGKKRPKCPAKKTAKAAARRVQRGQSGRSGRPLANARWCRNFMNLDVDEKDLQTA